MPYDYETSSGRTGAPENDPKRPVDRMSHLRLVVVCALVAIFLLAIADVLLGVALLLHLTPH